MTKKQFWQNASNWGMICGGGLFVVSLISWALDGSMSVLPEFLRFVLIFAVIYFSGRRNAALTGPEGYPYGRAVGFVFATMMFAGIVAGVGEFLMANFIAREHYDTLNAAQMETALRMYQGTPLYEQVLDGRDMMVRLMANPLVLIFGAVITYVFKGGLLGLIVAAFVKKNPDIFAATDAEARATENE